MFCCSWLVLLPGCPLVRLLLQHRWVGRYSLLFLAAAACPCCFRLAVLQGLVAVVLDSSLALSSAYITIRNICSSLSLLTGVAVFWLDEYSSPLVRLLLQHRWAVLCSCSCCPTELVEVVGPVLP